MHAVVDTNVWVSALLNGEYAPAQVLRAGALVVAVAGDVRLCRDPDDNVVLETAMRGHAEAVVSRDEDLTRDPELGEYLAAAGISLLTVARFLGRIRRP